MTALPTIILNNHPLVGIHSDLSNEAYQASPGLSRSAIAKVVNKSPAHYAYDEAHKEEQENAGTPAMLFGQALHDALLLPHLYQSQYAFEPKIDKRTKAGKEAYAAFLQDNANKIIIPPQGEEPANIVIDAIVRNVMSHKNIARFFAPQVARFEQSIFWVDQETGLLCKCRPDLFIAMNDEVLILDVKTTLDASKEGFARSVSNFDYYVQAAHYLEGVKSMIPDARVYGFVFLAIEKIPPYDFALYCLDQDYLALGKAIQREGLRIIAQSHNTGVWPGYPKTSITLKCPPWLLRKEL